MFTGKKSRVIILLVGIILVLSTFGSLTFAQQQQKVITWNRWQDGTTFGAQTAHFKYTGCSGVTQGWIDWVAKETKGRLIIKRSEPGALVSQADSFRAVKSGMIEGLGVYFSAQHAGMVPEANIESGLPFAWPTTRDSHYAFYHLGLYEEFSKIYAKHNLIWFPVVFGDIYHLGTTFPINRPEDLKGKKIRAIGIYGDYVRALGGTPVVIPGQEMYMALKLGTIDGVVYGLQGLSEWKLEEVLKYYVVEPSLSAIPVAMFINMDKWKELPEDIRDSILRNSPYVFESINRDYEMFIEFVARHAEENYGLKRITWSAEDTKKARDLSINILWKKVAGLSENCARLVDIVKDQQKQLGRIK